jgi:hypothetical protein
VREALTHGARPDIDSVERRWRGALTVVLAIYGVWCMAKPDEFHFLDALDLPIHETGHLVFAWGGEVITALSGTLFQLIVPLAFVVYFWRRGDRHSASVPLWWVGQNCWNIARYVADARAMELPLVGGGEHDWNFLLSVWGVLPKDAEIAHDLRFVGGLIVVASVCMGWWALATSGPDGNAEYDEASATES